MTAPTLNACASAACLGRVGGHAKEPAATTGGEHCFAGADAALTCGAAREHAGHRALALEQGHRSHAFHQGDVCCSARSFHERTHDGATGEIAGDARHARARMRGFERGGEVAGGITIEGHTKCEQSLDRARRFARNQQRHGGIDQTCPGGDRVGSMLFWTVGRTDRRGDATLRPGTRCRLTERRGRQHDATTRRQLEREIKPRKTRADDQDIGFVERHGRATSSTEANGRPVSNPGGRSVAGSASMRSMARRARSPIGRDLDFVLQQTQRVVDVFERDALHVWTKITGANELGRRTHGRHVVGHRALGEQHHLRGCMLHHPVAECSRRACEICSLQHLGRTLGMSEHHGARVCLAQAGNIARRETRVHFATPRPSDHAQRSLRSDVTRKVFIGDHDHPIRAPLGRRPLGDLYRVR